MNALRLRPVRAHRLTGARGLSTAVILACLLTARSAEPGSQPEVWLCAGERINQLLQPDADWPYSRQHLSGIKLYVDQIDRATPDQLARLVRLVNAQNYQRGGHESDERFFHETLAMMELYRRAGGQPERWFVQSWYPFPKQMVPETAPHSMTALVKAVIERVRHDAPERASSPGEALSPDLTPPARPLVPPVARSPGAGVTPARSNRIELTAVPGKMVAVARVPTLGGQTFSLGIPETIGSRERMILNFPEVDGRLTWTGPAEDGAIESEWTTPGTIHYHARLVPGEDWVDVEMTIQNLSGAAWHDVFAFNCLNPTGAKTFQDWNLERTYLSHQGQPLRMAETTRVRGHMPTVQFYVHEQTPPGQESPFVRGFSAISPHRTTGSWIVTLSEDGRSHMAATSLDSLFLFNNLDRCCIHAAPQFGDLNPGEHSSTVARFYFAWGDLETFLGRMAADRDALAARQARAGARRSRRSRGAGRSRIGQKSGRPRTRQRRSCVASSATPGHRRYEAEDTMFEGEPKVPWSGKHNTISCPAGHHFREGRWIRDPKYLDDYSVFWFRKGGDPRRYSFWAADSIYQRALALGDFTWAIELLPDLIANYEAWEKEKLEPDGLFWQIDDRDGMEVSIGGQAHGGQGKRPTINS